jgi:hypothetical protein
MFLHWKIDAEVSRLPTPLRRACARLIDGSWCRFNPLCACVDSGVTRTDACRVPATTRDLDLAGAPVETEESKAIVSRFMMVTLEHSMPTKLDVEFLSD